MSALPPDLDAQRRAARRAFAQGRRWYLRGILLGVVAAVALWRGGSFNRTLGISLAIVALLAAHLGRQMRRTAEDMERKIALMESGTAHQTPSSTPGPRPPAPDP